MDIKELKTFIHLTQTLHFATTAREMNMSPSTLSRTIQRLENDIGQSLLERDNRTVTLTQSGKRYLEFAHGVLNQWNHLQNDLNTQNNNLFGMLKLFCTVTASVVYAPKLLDAFKNLYPTAELKLETGDVAQAFEKINQKTVDFAYAVLPDNLDQQYEFHTIESIEFKLIAPTMTTTFSENMEKSSPDWRTMPFIIPESGPVRQRMKDWFKKMQIKPNIYAQVSGHEAIVSMTALGCGVSAIPAPVLEHSPFIDSIKILNLSIAPTPLTLGICCLKKSLKKPLNKAFWDLLKSVYS